MHDFLNFSSGVIYIVPSDQLRLNSGELLHKIKGIVRLK